MSRLRGTQLSVCVVLEVQLEPLAGCGSSRSDLSGAELVTLLTSSLSQSVFHFLLCCFHVVIQLEEVSNILHTEARQNKLVFVTCCPKRVIVRS